jgi:indolepyruvate decarboxylase
LTRLYQCGIETVFGVPGDFNLALLELLMQRSEMEWVGNCNELNAAYAADAYARMKGAGALIVTYGVGDLSAINGVAGSFAEHLPVVCISGIPPMHALRKRMLLHHTSGTGNMEDVMHCMAQFTVAHARITPANAAAEIDRVLCSGMREKRPVYLQIPSDIMDLEIAAPARPLDWAPKLADPAQLLRAVDAIAERLSKAERPAILVDGDAHRFGLRPVICALGQTLGIPFAAMPSGRNIFDEQHPLYRGLYVGDGSPAAGIVESSDCLLAIGARFFDLNTSIFTHEIDERSMILLESFAVNIGGTLYEGVSAEDVLRELGRRLEATKKQEAVEDVKGSAPCGGLEADRNASLTHAQLWPRIERFLSPDDVVLAEAGTSFSGICGIRLPAGAAFISQAVWGSIGYTLPATLGSMKAVPHRRHLLFIGDGSVQMTAQEISTMVRSGLKPILFVINNDGYTIERLIHGPESAYNDIQPWDYSRLPEVFQPKSTVRSFKVRTIGDLDDVLEEVRSLDGLALVELMIDRLDAPDSLVAMGRRVAEFDYGKP